MPTQRLSNSEKTQSLRLPDIFDQSPTFTSTSVDAGWNNINLEAFSIPPGETAESYFDHYVLGINLGQKSQASLRIEGKSHTATLLQGTTVISPIHRRHSYIWDSPVQVMALSLKPALLNRNALEILGSGHVELIPNIAVQDSLIYQIGLALQTELRSHQNKGRLYAEAMADALAVHLLRHYSTLGPRTFGCNGGLSQHKLRLVTDYINDYLERELSLTELASITQLSQYHFCRAFKQSQGLSPHQYLIQQRIDRAKQLLKKGGMKISEVAIACGFAHQSHFHRHFKRITGITPKSFVNL